MTGKRLAPQVGLLSHQPDRLNRCRVFETKKHPRERDDEAASEVVYLVFSGPRSPDEVLPVHGLIIDDNRFDCVSGHRVIYDRVSGKNTRQSHHRQMKGNTGGSVGEEASQRTHNAANTSFLLQLFHHVKLKKLHGSVWQPRGINLREVTAVR